LVRWSLSVSPPPKYRLVADSLAAEIAAGRFKAGDQIPSERVIAEEMGISRMTVRQALRHLADRGMVEARVGQGTFVGAKRLQQQLSTLTGFTEEMEKQGRSAASIVVEAALRAPEPETAAALGLPRARGLAHLARPAGRRRAGGDRDDRGGGGAAPALLERADFARTSLYETLRKHYGLRPATAEQTLAAASADPSVAATLGIAVGAPSSGHAAHPRRGGPAVRACPLGLQGRRLRDEGSARRGRGMMETAGPIWRSCRRLGDPALAASSPRPSRRSRPLCGRAG
jgi:GntR family transcriptional regulator